MSSHSHERSSTDGRVREPKPHDLGLQISCVFIPKCRRKTLYQELRRHLGEVFRRLALQKESKVEEGHLMGCADAALYKAKRERAPIRTI